MPAPRIASVRESGRASSARRDRRHRGRADRGDRAGVHERPRLRRSRRRRARRSPDGCRGRAPGSPGAMHDRLQRVERRGAAAVRRHQAHQGRRLRRPDDEAQRVVELVARERGQHLRHRLDALGHRQQPAHVVLAQDPDASREERAYAVALPGRRAEARAPRATGSRCAGAGRPADGAGDVRVREHPGECERRHVDAACSGLAAASRSSPSKTRSATRCSYGSGRIVIREPSGNRAARGTGPRASRPRAARTARS